MIPRHAIKR